MKRLLVVVLFLASACQGDGSSLFAPGPLAPSVNGWSLTGLPAQPGQAVTFGNNWIGDDTQPIPTFKILSVGLVDPSPGLMVAGVGVQDARFTATVANGEPYPPQAPLHTLPFEADYALNIVIGVKAMKRGQYFARSIRFAYEVGGRVYEASSPSGVQLCVPRCPP